jgi:hypothetical protein
MVTEVDLSTPAGLPALTEANGLLRVLSLGGGKQSSCLLQMPCLV